jgi:hypothetical protein
MGFILTPQPTGGPIDRTGGGFGQQDDSRNNTQRSGFNPNRYRTNGDNTTSAPMLLGLGGALLFLSICLLAARLWSRLRPWRLKLDDWTVLGATVCSHSDSRDMIEKNANLSVIQLLAIVQYCLLAASVYNGLGRHSRFVPFSARRASLRLTFISQVFWYWSITLVKLSVALLLLRLKHTKRWRFFLYFVMMLSLAAVTVQTFFQFLQCRPFSVYWDPRTFRTGEVRCFKRSVINGNIVAFSCIQVGLDLVFSFIPIIFIRKLNRPRRERIFMCVLMGLGLFASCAAIIRTMTLQGFYTSGDIFRSNVAIALWAVIEQQFALIAANIPTLKAFMEKTIVRVGLFFYDEGTEEHVRGKLVQFGLLAEGEELKRPEAAAVERRPSKGSVKSGVGIVRTPRSVGMRSAFGEMLDEKEEEVAFERIFGVDARNKEKDFV